MTDKKDCYYVIPRIPFPPVGGDRLKYFNSIKVLSRQFALHVIIVSDEKLSAGGEAFLKQYTENFKIFTYSKFHFRANALLGLFSASPIQVNYYYFKEVSEYCRKLIKPGDIVIANLIRTALYVIDLPNKKILNFEDSIYLNYKSSIKNVSSLFWKIIYAIEIKRLKRFEEKCIEKFDCATFVNINEQQYYSAHKNTTWLPNGVSTELCDRKFNSAPSQTNEVAYLGKMDYQPNVDAVIWFANNVISQYPHIKLKIIGAKPNKRVLALQRKYPDNITITGYVDDPFVLMNASTAVVAPMQTGAGIQNKILEAMAIGCVVLSSPLGAAPIKGAENYRDLVVCSTPEDYALLITRLQEDGAFKEKISGNARKWIRQNYTWDIYGATLFNLIDKLYALQA